MHPNTFVKRLEELGFKEDHPPSENAWHFSGNIGDTRICVDLFWGEIGNSARIFTREFKVSGYLQEISDWLLAAYVGSVGSRAP